MGGSSDEKEDDTVDHVVCDSVRRSAAGPWPWSSPSLLHGAAISSTSTGAILLFHWGSWLGCFEMIAIPVERQITHICNITDNMTIIKEEEL